MITTKCTPIRLSPHPQVLYVNLITAVTMGLMLAVEPAEPSVMDRPPRRPGKRLAGKLVLWRSAFVSGLLVVLVLSMFYWAGQLGYNIAQRRAEAFNVLVRFAVGNADPCLLHRLYACLPFWRSYYGTACLAVHFLVGQPLGRAKCPFVAQVLDPSSLLLSELAADAGCGGGHHVELLCGCCPS